MNTQYKNAIADLVRGLLGTREKRRQDAPDGNSFLYYVRCEHNETLSADS